MLQKNEEAGQDLSPVPLSPVPLIWSANVEAETPFCGNLPLYNRNKL